MWKSNIPYICKLILLWQIQSSNRQQQLKTSAYYLFIYHQHNITQGISRTFNDRIYYFQDYQSDIKTTQVWRTTFLFKALNWTKNSTIFKDLSNYVSTEPLNDFVHNYTFINNIIINIKKLTALEEISITNTLRCRRLIILRSLCIPYVRLCWAENSTG